jgi:hypothetical protein
MAESQRLSIVGWMRMLPQRWFGFLSIILCTQGFKMVALASKAAFCIALRGFAVQRAAYFQFA